MQRIKIIHLTFLLLLTSITLIVVTRAQGNSATPPRLTTASANNAGQVAGPFVQVTSFASSPALPHTLVGTFAGEPSLRYSLDDGLSWQSVYTMPWGSASMSIALAPRADVTAPTRLLVAASSSNQSLVGIYRTGDFGQTWTKMTFPHPASCNEPDRLALSVSLADPQRLYLTKTCWYDDGEISDLYTGVYTSDDAGITWQAIMPDSHAGWSGLTPSPVIPSRVYVIDNNGQWFQSDNSGLTWTPKNFPTISLVLDAQDPLRLYSLGIRSTDGGSQWSAWQTQPCAGSFMAHPTLTNVLFLQCTEGIYRSDDGGDHWTLLSAWTGHWLGPNYGNPGQILWARRDGLWATTDQGATWTELLDNFDFNLWPWQNISTPNSVGIIRALTPLSSTEVWAVGAGGSILNWKDKQWTRVPSPVSAALYSSAFVSPDLGWAVGGWDGGGGVILEWNGSVWTQVFTPTGVLRSVDVVSADDAWAVGDHGTILHWDGAQWTDAISSTATFVTRLTAVDMISATEGWAVGGDEDLDWVDQYSPVILRWDGTSWSRVDVTVHAYSLLLQSIDMFSETDGWALGAIWPNMGTLLRWNGESWQEVLYTLPAFLCLSMASPDEGWISKLDGNLLEWDGSVWTERDLPDQPIGTVNVIACNVPVAALPSGQVWTIREGGVAFYQGLSSYSIPWVQK